MFECFNAFLDRLTVHLGQPMSSPVRTVVIQFLALLLKTIGTTTKLIRDGRLSTLNTEHRRPWAEFREEMFFRNVLGKRDEIRQLLDELDTLSSREVATVSTVTLAGVNSIVEKMQDMMLGTYSQSIRMFVSL
jgi:hypothetical protein